MTQVHEHPEIQQLREFFQAYERLENGSMDLHVREELGQLGPFLSSLRSLEKALQPIRRQEASRYNLFEILNIRHLEAKVHSPFLANLLQPYGSHAHGDLFLRAFLKDVANRPDWIEGLKYVTVKAEKHTGDGFIDILIEGHHRTGRFAIVIENKIYAGDQEDQLSRYQLFLAKKLGLDKVNSLLIYLTPHGAKPSIPHSLTQFQYDDWTKDDFLQLHSYRIDIYQWISQLILEIESEKVRSTIQQYLQILRRL